PRLRHPSDHSTTGCAFTDRPTTRGSLVALSSPATTRTYTGSVSVPSSYGPGNVTGSASGTNGSSVSDSSTVSSSGCSSTSIWTFWIGTVVRFSTVTGFGSLARP